MKTLAGIRLLLECFVLILIVLFLAFCFFPGIRNGLGVSEALRLARVAATAPNAQVSPIASPADLMAVLLTVATIVLAAVAFLVSVSAFFGYAKIKEIVEATASAEVSPLRLRLEQATEAASTQLRAAVRDLDQRFDELKTNLEAERIEGQGLAQGQASDAIANASSNSTTTTP